jgi:septum site-determining protein MinC
MADTIQTQSIQIKGVREGLLVTLGEGEWIDLRENLLKEVAQKEAFLKGAKIALDVGSHVIKAAELGSLRDALSEMNIGLWAVISTSPTTEQTAQILGLATRLSTPRKERQVHTLDTDNLSGESAILVQRTLRSGFKLSYAGHIVVVGDVNPGAEVIAGGSVVVWGRLRGSVIAGNGGLEGAVVCALEMNPTQVRIGEKTLSLQKNRGKQSPVMVSVKKEQIIEEPWNPKGEKGGTWLLRS